MNGRSSSLSSNSRSNVKKDSKHKKSKKRSPSSSSSSSSGSSSLFSDSYSDSFSSSASLSHNDKEDKSKLKNGILRRSSSSLNSRRTTSSLSKNDDDDFSSSSSLNSARTNLSKAHSLKNLEIEYEPVIASNLSFNVYQALFSIKASNINIYNLKKEYQVTLIIPYLII